MNKSFILILLILIGCGKKDEGGSSSSSSSGVNETATTISRSLFEEWTENSTGVVYDMTGGEHEVILDFYAIVYLDQDFIDVLDTAGRDTTGLSDGDTRLCNYAFYSTSNGTLILDLYSHADTPAINHCMVLDNFCHAPDSNLCNYNFDHLWSIENNQLTIDFFGSNETPGEEFALAIFE